MTVEYRHFNSNINSRETTPKTDFMIMSISAFNSSGRMNEGGVDMLDEAMLKKKKKKNLK